jgi:tRNA modification GTPase
VIELNIHSSPYIIKRITQILLNVENVKLADAGEFTKRAFLNGKIDLVQAEAIPDLIASETSLQHQQAFKQLDGKLGKIYEKWRFEIIEVSAMIEALIDFPDEDLPIQTNKIINNKINNLKKEISAHLNDNKIGQKIKEGLNIAIIGAPNTGKSSLINFLSGSEIAIVSKIAGTTRDIIETQLEISGVPVKISDTAGIRKSNNKIELEGINRALKKAKNSDIKLYMVDALKPIFDKNIIDENTILVINKIDKIKNLSKIDELKNKNCKKNYDSVKISITKEKNIKKLISKIENKINKLIPSHNHVNITQERYRIALQNAYLHLSNFDLKRNIEINAEDLRIASTEIGKINGKIDIDNILDVIFAKFCIGK